MYYAGNSQVSIYNQISISLTELNIQYTVGKFNTTLFFFSFNRFQKYLLISQRKTPNCLFVQFGMVKYSISPYFRSRFYFIYDAYWNWKMHHK